MTISEAVLERAGLRVSPAQFEALVVDALALVVPRRDADAAGLLTNDQLQVLQGGGVDPLHLDPEVDGPDGPVARGAALYAALLASSLGVPQAAERLHVDESRVRQRIAKRTLYAFKAGVRWLLPSFQFDGDGALVGIERVLPRLDPALAPLAVTLWFQRPNPSLVDADGTAWTPRDWLRTGHSVEPVAASATSLGILG